MRRGVGVGDQQAAVAAEPQPHGEPLAVGAVRVEGLRLLDIKAGLREPFLHLPVRKAEPLMRVFGAQELKIMRFEVDDHQPAGRPEQARCFAHGAGGPSWRVWPIYGNSRWEGRYDRWFLLWPIWTYEKNLLHLPPEKQETKWMLLPIVGRTTRGTFSSTSERRSSHGSQRRRGDWMIDRKSVV